MIKLLYFTYIIKLTMSLTFSPIDNQVAIPITRINSNTLATPASFSAITTTAIF